MMISIVISTIVVFLIIYLVVKYYTKRVNDRVNLQILEVLSEIFDTSTIDIKSFKIRNTHQTLKLLQVVIGALGDTLQYFKDQYNVDNKDLIDICLDFATKRCKELNIEVNQENKEFMTTVILTYMESHELSSNKM